MLRPSSLFDLERAVHIQPGVKMLGLRDSLGKARYDPYEIFGLIHLIHLIRKEGSEKGPTECPAALQGCFFSLHESSLQEK